MESFHPLWFVTLAFEKSQLGVSKMVPFVSELSLFNPFCHKTYRQEARVAYTYKKIRRKVVNFHSINAKKVDDHVYLDR